MKRRVPKKGAAYILEIMVIVFVLHRHTAVTVLNMQSLNIKSMTVVIIFAFHWKEND